MSEDEAPLIERYRMLIELFWVQTESLDRIAQSAVLLLGAVPDGDLKTSVGRMLNSAIATNRSIVEHLTNLGISAQEET